MALVSVPERLLWIGSLQPEHGCGHVHDLRWLTLVERRATSRLTAGGPGGLADLDHAQPLILLPGGRCGALRRRRMAGPR